MNCLCCGKELRNSTDSLWHKSCIKKFFNTNQIPKIDIDENTLQEIANINTSNGYTVPGVQKKLSLHLFSNNKNPRLTLLNYPSGYILKPQVKEFKCMPESEHLVMNMADKTGIKTVPHAIINNNNQYAYITKRIDRIIQNGIVKYLAMEDFCQLDNKLTIDKYRGSYERCAKIINDYSSRLMFDMSEFYLRIIFCYITGNSDMHLKNFSLIETSEASNLYVLSPAYDLLPVNVLMPEDSEEVALPLNGKKKNLKKKDFYMLCESCNLNKSVAIKIIDKVLSMKDTYIKMCQESLLSDELKESFITLINKRVKTFE